MNPARAERRAKALGLALVGSMFVVALGVHSWPRRAPLLSATIPVRVAALAQAPAGIVPVAVVVRSAPQVVVVAQRPGAPAERSALSTHPIVARMADVVIGDPVTVPRPPVVLDTAPFVTLAKLPDVDGERMTAVADAEDDAPWDSMAHAGVALGRVFREAGVKTASAFARVF